MLLLIDGSNLAYRSLHALYKDVGYYSYLEAVPYVLKRLVNAVEYHHSLAGVIVAWDKGLPLHRRRLYADYKPDSTPIGNFDSSILSKINKDPSLKAHRTSNENADLRKEYNKLVDILSTTIIPCCNCVSSRVVNTEADDIIAYCCYFLKDIEKQIISSDRDLIQLVDETTSVYNFASSNSNNKIYDYEWLLDNYDPKWFREHFLTEKAITGDDSDNIPGIEAVGSTSAKKYAANIIESRKLTSSINEAIYNVERPPRASKKGWENIRGSSDIIKRNMDIMDLHLPIATKLDMVYQIQGNLASSINKNIDYYSAIEKLESIEELNYNTFYLEFDRIFESNCNFEMKETLERLRDAF